MQDDKMRSLQLIKAFGEVVKELRSTRTDLSINKFADAYDISRGNLSKIESGKGECKLVTLWKIAEALGIPLSELILALETKLGKDFKLIDE